MMQYEFEAIAGYEVSSEDYDTIIEPMYRAARLSKSEFVKCISRERFELKEEKVIRAMLVRNALGQTKTPNGCCYYIQYVELVGSDIAEGKSIVKALDAEDLDKLTEQGRDIHLGYSYDMDYTQCIDAETGKAFSIR